MFARLPAESTRAPLDRDPARVREDVADDYVSLERARRDYGVVLRVVDADLAEYEVEEDATRRERDHIRAHRRAWIEEDPQRVSERFQARELDAPDVIRRHAVLLDWGTGAVLETSTAQFREAFKRRSADHWRDRPASVAAD